MEVAVKENGDQLQSQIESYIESQRPVYEALASSAGFNLSFGAVTCFDHTSDTVIIGVGQLALLGITEPEEIDFIVLHELGHFKEFFNDPAGYLKVIEDCKAKKELTKLYFDLHNCLADVYVNQNSANIAPVYATSTGYTPLIQKLYREKAFHERDFTSRPLCVQYMDCLLNMGMGVHEDIKLSPAVEAEILRGTELFGQEISYAKLVSTYLVPTIGTRRSDDWRATVTERNFIMGQSILPVFEKLLKADQAAGRDPSKGSSNILGILEPGEGDIEAAVRRAQAIQREANLTPDEHADRERSRQASNAARDAGLSENDAKSFAERLTRLQPVIEEIVPLLEKIKRRVIDWIPVQNGHFRTGDELDLDKAIEDFAIIRATPSEAELMVQKSYEERRSSVPRIVRLWLVPDLSGSMDGEVEVLKDLVVVLTAAMATLSTQRELDDTALGGGLAVIGFASKPIEIIKPNNSPTLFDAAAAFAKVVAKGGTKDHLALSKVLANLSVLQEEGEEGESTNLLIEITDGDTEKPWLTSQKITELEGQGVICRAIKILGGHGKGDETPDEADVKDQKDTTKPSAKRAPNRANRSSFEQIWNRGEVKRGHYVMEAKRLPAVLMEILEKLEERE